MLKLAIVMPLAEQRGGAELALWTLMQQGPATGIDWLVLFLEDGPMAERFRDLGVSTRVIPAGRLRHAHRFAVSVLHIARIVRRERAQAIIAWMGKPHLYGGPAALLAGVPSLWYQHGVPSGRSSMDQVVTLIPARGILTCSQAAALGQARLRPARPTRVVYPGVELARFDPGSLPTPAQARRRLGLPVGGPLIGMVGRLQRWKGMHVLVEAMPRILESHPDAHCVLVGGAHSLEPGYRRFLADQIDALGLGAQVTLAGLQRNVPEWMQAMDVIVHASDNEPFGIVVIEAMALAKPVVAGAAGGPREIITDGVDGLLAPYGDPEALAGAVLRYLDEPSFAARAACAARRRALEFSTERYARSFVTAVRELLS